MQVILSAALDESEGGLVAGVGADHHWHSLRPLRFLSARLQCTKQDVAVNKVVLESISKHTPWSALHSHSHF
jgi:hypothetical protein